MNLSKRSSNKELFYEERSSKENIYNIKLYGYYLVLADFGHARSFELVDIIEHSKNVNSFIESTDMNPYYELLKI